MPSNTSAASADPVVTTAEVRPLPDVDTLTPAALAEVAETLAAHSDLWERIAAQEEGAFSTRLAMGRGWEAWLQGWPPGHRSGLHDHGVSAGAFAVVRGELDETVLRPGGGPGVPVSGGTGFAAGAAAVSGGVPGPARLQRRKLSLRSLRSFGGDLVHDLANPGDVPAISVHVLGPVPRVRGYEVDEDGVLLRTGTTATGWW